VRPTHLYDAGIWKKLGLKFAPEGEATEGAAAPVPVERLTR